MSKLTHQQRAELYHKSFPDWPPLRYDNRWVDGVWVLGNDYRNTSSLYGAYPPQFLKRIQTLFPDAKDVLHLFSGSLEKGNYTRFDCNEERDTDVRGDAHKLSFYFKDKKFDLIYADPPYSIQDAERYGTSMVKRKVVFKECAKVLKKGGHLVWLDQALPQFAKVDFHWWGLIAIQRSSNHRIRGCYLFEKV